MSCLTVSFFLSLFLVTQATDFSYELNRPPLPESVYVFTVESDAPVDEIKKSLDVLDGPRHSFRVIGENTYHFVAVSNSTTALRHLTFPKGSKVTQYPVAHSKDGAKIYGLENGLEENDTADALPDTVLTYHEFYYDFHRYRYTRYLQYVTVQSINKEGTPVKQFELMLFNLVKAMIPVFNKTKCLTYIPIGYYPRKIISFMKLDDNADQFLAKDVQDMIGGIGILVQKVKHIVKI